MDSYKKAFKLDKSSSFRDVFTVLLSIVLAVAILLGISGWIVMVVFGSVASIFGWQTISYTEGIVLSIGLTVLGGFFRKP